MPSLPLPLDQQLVIVTGASRGLGAAIARAFLREGARVVINYLNSDAAAPIREKYADRFVYCTPQDEEYSDQPVPIAIDLSGTVLTGEYSAYPEGAVLGINAGTKRLDQAAVLLDYLFARKG